MKRETWDFTLPQHICRAYVGEIHVLFVKPQARVSASFGKQVVLIANDDYRC